MSVADDVPELSQESTGFESLSELALDMYSSWNHAGDSLWHQLDPVLWELTHNPWVVLQTVAPEKIRTLLNQPEFHSTVDTLISKRRKARQTPGWFQQKYPDSPLTCVAYFSMEFMLSEALPIYSGGLGNVAGDQLKAASDLGLPVVGIGLLYQQGYFRQVIDAQGRQQALYPYNDPGQLPITPLRDAKGQWIRMEIPLPGYSVWLRTWQVQVGGVKLFLLDSNDAANFPAHRGITSELYGGGPELRLLQELVLGIGGWRLLTALGIKPEVCHLNEGHAAFAVLERALSYMHESGLNFQAALAATRAGNLFTTHTAVAAGFDRFPPALIAQYLGHYAQHSLGISLDELLALGRQNPADDSEPFNMAWLAVRGSGAVNAVSRLHGKVSRQLFAPLFPHWPLDEVPINHVTNGVHMPTWDSAAADAFWTNTCGKSRWLGDIESHEADIHCVSDTQLWEFRTQASTTLVNYARKRLSRQLAGSGALASDIERAAHLFDPNVLTLGFARRFATYKRPNLLLHDPERLLRLLSNPQHPVQLIMAGKAHPADTAGQALIEQWLHFIRDTDARQHVIFLSDYDMQITGQLVQGVDVWLNTPRRPWEACGTSGMKVLVNGGINLSVLDGWWAEAWDKDVGWALGDGEEHGDDPAQDVADAQALYELLENSVIPEFYTRDSSGIPTAWVARMRESMARLTPQFSTNRSVSEYTENYYLPAASRYLERTRDQGKFGTDLLAWQHQLITEWDTLRFGELSWQTENGSHTCELQVYLDGFDATSIQVELYADGLEGGPSECIILQIQRELVGAVNGYVYGGQVPTTRPTSDYTARLRPLHAGLIQPLEEAHILWQH